MKFDRLSLTGFKSFVDATDLVIRDGLTGVVGPNGCGKSNLLEALRWVMGENRPTAMRGEGMEDVIFAGSASRGARAVAEVSLIVDNRDRLAPAAVNDTDTIEVVRRIARDAGSVYRINGKECRARDVQMLFADASTGAHSPALVRKGQIATLISARPKARRRILEEAAGISGLYARRHEAELKLNAAELNLSRVGDTLDQLGAQAASLARQARAAARYREIGAALRQAGAVLLYRRWAAADADRAATMVALEQTSQAVTAAESSAQTASDIRETADAALPGLREEEQIATSLQARAAAERLALDDAEIRAAETIESLRARLAQLDRDIAREAQLNRDASEVVERLAWEKAQIAKAGQGHDDRVQACSVDANQAGAALNDLEIRLAEVTNALARMSAQADLAATVIADLTKLQDRAKRTASDAEAALQAAGQAGAQAAAELCQAETRHHDATDLAARAEVALAASETARSVALDAEAAARAARSAAEGEAAALRAEIASTGRMVAQGAGDGQAVLSQITVEKGYEAALGAALGDDLSAPVASEASGWVALPAYDENPPLPDGTTPLAARIRGPALLARRFSQIAIAANADAAQQMQHKLLPGQRIVTVAGGLWRWDGLRVIAGQASSAAARHLEQVNRLADLRALSEKADQRAVAAVQSHTQLNVELHTATGSEKSARDAYREADRALLDAARRVSNAQNAVSTAQARAVSARSELGQQIDAGRDLVAKLATARAQMEALGDRSAAAAAVEAVRTDVEAARMTAMARNGALRDMKAKAEARARRLQAISAEQSGWSLRLEQAGARAEELALDRERLAVDLQIAEAAPAQLSVRRSGLQHADAVAQSRLNDARTALRQADTALRDASVAQRETERLASDAREARAVSLARAQTATQIEAACRAAILAEAGMDPQALRDQLELPEGEVGTAAGTGPDLDALEAQIGRLRAQRDALGAVNLRADDDKRELEAERDRLASDKADLEAAIRKLRGGIGSLNREGRERLLLAFDTVNRNFATLFVRLFGGGEARLVLVESDDPLDAGLEIMCQPPGKKLSTLSLLSGGEQTLTAMALIFAVFLANPAPICVLDEVDAPLDDANVSRFCDLLDEMTRRTETRFLVITHHSVTMSRMDRLFGVTMVEQGVSQLVSVDLERAEALVA